MVNNMQKSYNRLPCTKHFSFARNKDGPSLEVTLNFWTSGPKYEVYGETVFRDVTRFSFVALPQYMAFHPQITQSITMFKILTFGVQFFI